MVKLFVAAAALAILLGSCAHTPDTRPLEAPGATEIGTYVAAHWTADFNQRFSRFAGRTGNLSELVSVQNARCEPNWGGTVAECSYDVTARFADGQMVTRQLQSQFERGGDGDLTEVLIIWHERKH